jgi:hypothetical protein
MGTPYPSYGPPKLVETRGIEGFSPRTHQTLGQRKPQNRAPFLTDFREESKGKEPRRVHTYIRPQIPKRKVPKTLQEIHQERAPKITTKNEREHHIQTLRKGRIIYTSQRGSYKV